MSNLTDAVSLPQAIAVKVNGATVVATGRKAESTGNWWYQARQEVPYTKDPNEVLSTLVCSFGEDTLKAGKVHISEVTPKRGGAYTSGGNPTVTHSLGVTIGGKRYRLKVVATVIASRGVVVLNVAANNAGFKPEGEIEGDLGF